MVPGGMARLRHHRGRRCNSSTATGAFSRGRSSRERLGLRNVVRARDISQRNPDERPGAREHHVLLRLVVPRRVRSEEPRSG